MAGRRPMTEDGRYVGPAKRGSFAPDMSEAKPVASPPDRRGFLRRLYNSSGRDTAGNPKEVPQEPLNPGKPGPWSGSKPAPAVDPATETAEFFAKNNKGTPQARPISGRPSSIPITEAAPAAAAPAEASAKGFFTELGQLMKKWGAPSESLGEIAPVASQLFRFVAPVGLAAAAYDATRNPAAQGDAEDRARMFEDPNLFGKTANIPGFLHETEMQDIHAAADAKAEKLNKLANPTTRPAHVEGGLGDDYAAMLAQNAAAEPTQQPSEAAPAEVAQQPTAQPSEAPTAAQAQAEPTKEAPAALPKEGDVPEFLFQPGAKGKEVPVEPDKPAANAATITNPSKSKAPAKQEKPLSDEDIVAWNAQHNKSFAPQEGGSVPFQPAQGAKQSDGVLFVGGNVYMADPRDPSGYKLIHSYGQGNGQ